MLQGVDKQGILSFSSHDSYATLKLGPASSDERKSDLKVLGLLCVIHWYYLEQPPFPLSPFWFILCICLDLDTALNVQFIKACDREKYKALRPWFNRKPDADLNSVAVQSKLGSLFLAADIQVRYMWLPRLLTCLLHFVA